MALDKIKTDIIADDAVTTAKVADNAVTSAKLPDGGVAIADLATDTGITDKYHKVPVYANDAARDHNTTGTGTPAAGMIIFNTASEALEQYTGTAWSAIAPAPTFSGFSGTSTINEDDNTTVIIQGGQFISGMTVALHNNSGDAVISGHEGLSYVLDSSSQITVTVPSATSNITAGLVLYFKIIKSGLSVKTTTITVNADPTWASLSNPFHSTVKGTVAGTIATLPTATASTGGAIAYSLVSTTSATSNTFAINSSTGVVTSTATLTGPGSGSQTDVLVARATGPTGATQAEDLASINIIIHANAAAGGTIATYSTFAAHKFITNGSDDWTAGTDQTFTLYAAKTCDIILLAGGGAGSCAYVSYGGAGGGAGGLLVVPQITLAAGDYAIRVGEGGTTTVNGNDAGDTGGDSTLTGASPSTVGVLTAKGGGGGQGWSTTVSDADGGSGGGHSIDNDEGTQIDGTETFASYSGTMVQFNNSGYAPSGGGNDCGGGGGAGGAPPGDHREPGPASKNFLTDEATTQALLDALSVGHEISGTKWLASGGGGGGNNRTSWPYDDPIVGGGGAGGYGSSEGSTSRKGKAAIAGTGSGGGGMGRYNANQATSANNRGGAGGSGVVMIRYTA